MTNNFNVNRARIGVQLLPKPNSHWTDTQSTVKVQVALYSITQAFSVGVLLLEVHAGLNICF